jgi:hypothetical protein
MNKCSNPTAISAHRSFPIWLTALNSRGCPYSRSPALFRASKPRALNAAPANTRLILAPRPKYESRQLPTSRQLPKITHDSPQKTFSKYQRPSASQPDILQFAFCICNFSFSLYRHAQLERTTITTQVPNSVHHNNFQPGLKPAVMKKLQT